MLVMNKLYIFKDGEYLEAKSEEDLDSALAGGGVAISKSLFDSRLVMGKRIQV